MLNLIDFFGFLSFSFVSPFVAMKLLGGDMMVTL